MKRTNISLTEEQYEWVKEWAKKYDISRSSVHRDLVSGAMQHKVETPKDLIKGNVTLSVPEQSLNKKQFEQIYNPAPKPKNK